MLARPLTLYRQGKYKMHLEVGNPVLIIPSKKNDGTYYPKAVFPAFASHYDKNLVPIYDKAGKKIANTIYEDVLEDF